MTLTKNCPTNHKIDCILRSIFWFEKSSGGTINVYASYIVPRSWALKMTPHQPLDSTLIIFEWRMGILNNRITAKTLNFSLLEAFVQAVGLQGCFFCGVIK